MPSVKEHFINIRAEDEFKKNAARIGKEITPDHLRMMARKGITFAHLIKETNTQVPVAKGGNALRGVQHLKDLPDDRLLELLREAIPEHYEVLVENPEFAHGVIRDLRALAG